MTIEQVANALVCKLNERGMTMATAESCTGGGIGSAVTSVSGSSAVYLGGVVSYSNRVKIELLGVPDETIRNYGAVSYQTAERMADGVRTLIGANIAVSATGIAGPMSDDTKKPVGLVYIGISTASGTEAKEYHFSGDRAQVRNQTILSALSLVLEYLDEE